MKLSLIKTFEFITKANQIFFFVGILVIAGLFISVLTRELFRDSYSDPGVKIIDEKRVDELQKVEYEQKFITKLGDIFVFGINAKSVRISEPEESTTHALYAVGMSFDGYTRKRVNMLFIEGNKKLKLLKNDKFIVATNFAEEATGYEQFSTSKNIYRIIESDTNKDGFLNNDDSQNLYVSSVNGEDLKLIGSDIDRYEVIGDDLILIIKGGGKETEFVQYNLKTNQFTRIDTSF
ncbi:MAG: hypothetical protein OQK51_00860 [Kangiellaceae bacterium]|nr:hypothetical protein [Kangiellaceae bacterium]